ETVGRVGNVGMVGNVGPVGIVGTVGIVGNGIVVNVGGPDKMLFGRGAVVTTGPVGVGRVLLNHTTRPLARTRVRPDGGDASSASTRVTASIASGPPASSKRTRSPTMRPSGEATVASTVARSLSRVRRSTSTGVRAVAVPTRRPSDQLPSARARANAGAS